MKIRNGFVSNSSSSSFCIFGLELTNSKVMEVLAIDDVDGLYERTKGSDLQYVRDYDNQIVYVGVDPWSMGEDETKSQFRERITKALADFGFEGRPELHEGTVYN